MKRCQDCGAVMEDGFRFCPQCAAPADLGAEPVFKSPARFNAHYCGKCGAKLPAGIKSCLICGTGAGEAPAEEAPEEAAPGHPQKQEGEKRPAYYARKKNKVMTRSALLMSLVLLFTAAGVWAWEVVPYWISTDRVRADNAILYVQNHNTLRIKSADATEALTVAGYTLEGDVAVDNIAKASGDGRYLAYLNRVRREKNGFVGDLYLLDLGRMTRRDAQGEEGTLIAGNVTDRFLFSNLDGHLLYITQDGTLCSYDYQATRILNTEVDGVLAVNEKRVVYYRMLLESPDPRRSEMEVFFQDLAGGNPVLLGQVNELLDWTPELDRMVYTQNSRLQNNLFMQSVYLYDEQEDFHLLMAEDVDAVLDASAATEELLYLRRLEYRMDYGDFVDDDMASLDSRLQEPELSGYPSLAEYYEEYGEFPEEWDIVDGYEEEQEELITLLQEYGDLREEEREYAEKVERDRLRQRIHERIDGLYRSSVGLGELVYSSPETLRVLDHEVLYLDGRAVAEGDLQNRYALYVTANFELLEPAVMSQLSREEGPAVNPEQMLREILCQSAWLGDLAGEAPHALLKADLGESISEPFVTGNMEGVYFLVGRADTGGQGKSLFYCPLENGAPALTSVLDRGVQYIYPDQPFNGQLLYMKNYSRDGGNLYATRGGAFEQLSYDVYAGDGIQVVNGGRTLLYYENYDSQYDSADFYLTITQKRQVTTDVHAYYYRGDDLIYLLKNVRDGKGDLYAYGGGVLTLVDSGVTHVLPMYRIQAGS